MEFNYLKHVSFGSSDPDVEKLNWLLSLRRYVLLLQFPLSIIGNFLGYLNHQTHALMISIITMYLFYNHLVLRRLVINRRVPVTQNTITLQIVLDVSVFTVLLYLSGGANNPCYVFFHVFAVLGGVLLAGRQSWWFLGYLLFLVFSTNLDYLFPFDLQSIIHILTQLMVSTIIFMLARSLGDQLTQGSRQLMQLTLFTERLDRLRALGALSAGFSHEFASPLNTIKLRLKRLQKKSAPEMEEDLSEASEAAMECEAVLRQMNSSQLDLRAAQHEDVRVDTVVREIIKHWQQEHPLALLEFISEAQHAHIRVPKINFAQALLNLLDNGHEASEAGQLQVILRQREDQVELIIQDQGPGFPQEILEHVGEPFNTSKSKGTGLGIYTVHLFMDSVLGKIRIENMAIGARVTLVFQQMG